MPRYPTKQMTVAVEKLKDKPFGSVKFGDMGQHKLVKIRMYDDSTPDIGVTYSYSYKGMVVADIDIFKSGAKVPFMICGTRAVERDNVNGLFNLLGVTDYKAILIDNKVCARRVHKKLEE